MPLRITLGHRTAILAIDALFRPPSPARRPSSRASSTSTSISASSPLHPTSPRFPQTIAKIPRQPQRKFPKTSNATRTITTTTTTTSSSSSSSSSFWKSALTRYAKAPKPETLPKEEVLHYDDQTITIFDGFDKAKLHFLCLPRIPFRLKRGGEGGRSSLDDDDEGEKEKEKEGVEAPASSSPASSHGPTLSTAGGKLAFGRSFNGRGKEIETDIVPSGHLQSLSELLRSPYAGQVLAALEKAAKETVKRMQEMMPSIPLPSGEEANCIWDINLGFHAVPSMDTIHLHVISSDLVSDRLRHKKHYLSFHPEVGFWQSLSTIQALHQSGGKSLPRTSGYYEGLLRGPLVPLEWRPEEGKEIEGGKKSSKPFVNMPEVKRYLEMRWTEEVLARRNGTDSLVSMAGRLDDHPQKKKMKMKRIHSPCPTIDSQVSDVDGGNESQTESETESEGEGEGES